MSDAFDPYYQWLAIPPEDQPANHYRLLGLKMFESNADVIAHAADRQMAHVRSLQSGRHAAESQTLLNELSAARVCLLNAAQRADYDRALKAKLGLVADNRPAPTKSSIGSAAKRFATTPGGAAASQPAARRAAQPLTVARPLASTAPRPTSASQPKGVGAAQRVDPLGEGPQWRRQRRSWQKRPMVLAAAGLISLLAIGLVWIVWGGDNSPPVKPNDVAESTPIPQTGPRQPLAQPIQVPAGSPRPKSSGPVVNLLDDKPSPDTLAQEPPAAEEAPKRLTGGTDSSESGPEESAMSTAGDAAESLPQPPDAAAVKAATDEIRVLFKDDYAGKKPADRVKLAERLYALAGESLAVNERFALLSEARRAAIAGNSPALALQSLAEAARQFQIERLEMAADMIDEFAKKELKGPARQELLDAITTLVDECVTAEKFALVKRLTAVGVPIARKANNAEVAKTLLAQAKEVGDLEKQAAVVEAARKTLRENPNDPSAHLALGTYLCFAKDDWPTGLKHLKQGSDKKLQAAAELDLAAPEEMPEILKLGDAWWELSADASGITREARRSRAGFWYHQIAGELHGLNKTRVDKRLAEIGSLELPRDESNKEGVYLIDLPVSDVRVERNNPLRAEASYLAVNGKSSPQNFRMHPPGRGVSSHATFKLPAGRYSQLVGSVGVADFILRHGQPRAFSPLTFRIVADGKETWKSRPLQQAGDSVDFQVTVSGVKKLELFVDPAGAHDYAHAIWIQPRLSKRSAGSKLGAESRPPRLGKAEKSGGLKVVEAKFGSDTRWADVTERLQRLVRGNSLVFTVAFKDLPDPAFSVVKGLQLRYKLDGKTIDASYVNNDFVSLGHGPTPSNPKKRQVVITQALCGCGDVWIDVTEKMQKHPTGSQLQGQVTHDDLGINYDPWVGREKLLYVRYWLNDREHETKFLDQTRTPGVLQYKLSLPATAP